MQITFLFIFKEFNSEADAQANLAIDLRGMVNSCDTTDFSLISLLQ